MAEHIHHHFETDNGDTTTGANVFLVTIVVIAMFAAGALLFLYANGNIFQRSTTIDVTVPAAQQTVPTPTPNPADTTPQSQNY